MATRRNDPCPCGSGKKYKQCCEGKRGSIFGKSSALIGGVALVAAAGMLAISLNRKQEPVPAPIGAALPPPAATAPAPAPASAANAPAVPAAPPPGIAVPGRVWSEEHKHWHNVSKTENPIQVETTKGGGSGVVAIPKPENSAVVQYPQPPGPVPAGKIWSPLHGHWHDASAVNTSRPPGPAVMDVPPPPGPAPEGKVWSREHGHWHNAPKAPAQPQQ